MNNSLQGQLSQNLPFRELLYATLKGCEAPNLLGGPTQVNVPTRPMLRIQTNFKAGGVGRAIKAEER